MLKLVCACALSSLTTFPILGETLVVGLPEPGRVPFFWQDNAKGFRGTYVALLNRVSAMAGFTVEYRMVPQARLVAEFNAGMIDIEPGIAPSWRPSLEEQSISRYTASFMNMEDVLIIPQGRKAPGVTSTADLTKLNGLRIGQVRGFYVPPGLEVIPCVDEFSIARKVHTGAWDVGLMNSEVARWYKNLHRFSYEVSVPYASTPVAFRVHVEHERWVEPINGALSKLRKSGELQRILQGR